MTERITRQTVRQRIAALDAERDHYAICKLTWQIDFGFETHRALEFALFKTYAVPSISALLEQTGEFQRRGQKRYDDTTLLMAEITEHGYDSERGRAALRRMNQMHHRFPISNDDYLYVLSVFIYEPIRWNALMGWRALTEKEKHASYYFWREVGVRMNIHDIPASYDAFLAWADEYERVNFRFSPSNKVIGDATIAVFQGWFPSLFAPMVRAGILALLPDPLLTAFGFEKQSPALVALVKGTLRARAAVIRLLPKGQQPYLITPQRNPTYPNGYQISHMGTIPPDV